MKSSSGSKQQMKDRKSTKSTALTKPPTRRTENPQQKRGHQKWLQYSNEKPRPVKEPDTVVATAAPVAKTPTPHGATSPIRSSPIDIQFAEFAATAFYVGNTKTTAQTSTNTRVSEPTTPAARQRQAATSRQKIYEQKNFLHYGLLTNGKEP